MTDSRLKTAKEPDIRRMILETFDRLIYERNAAETALAAATAENERLSAARKSLWLDEWKPIINAIGEISVQEAMDAIERSL
jgi:hypothetical protein